MNNLQNMKELVGEIGNSDGPVTVFAAGKLGEMSVGILLAFIIGGLLFCFLGLKLIKIISALMGMGIGIAAGVVVSSIADITGFTKIILIFACAVVLAALTFFLHRVGIFLMVFIAVVSAAFIFVGVSGRTYIIAALGVAVVLGIVAMIFAEPGAIIITSVIGGISAGAGIVLATGVANPFIGLGAAAALAVTGMIAQFVMYSKRSDKAGETQVKKTKKKNSMESEVEKARMLLDDEEEEDIDD